MARIFTDTEIKRCKGDAGSTWWRAVWSRLLAWINTSDDRLDMAKLRCSTRVIEAEGESGSGYLSGQTFIHPLHVAPTDFCAFGVFLSSDKKADSPVSGTVYARVGYYDTEGEAHFPNEDYKEVDPDAPINFIPCDPDSTSGVFTAVSVTGVSLWFLETSQGEGDDIKALCEFIGYDAAVPPMFA